MNYSLTIYDSEPSAYYRFDGGDASSIEDVAGPNDLTGLNLSFSEDGLIVGDKNEGLVFDGSAYASRENPSSDVEPRLGQTLEAWISSSSASDMTIISHALDANNSFLLRFKSDRRVQAFWQIEGTYYKAQTTAALLELNTTYHIVATLAEDGSVSIYIDGQSRSTTSPGDFSGSVGSLLLGGASESTELFNGELDEVAVYRRELVATEVLDHYTAAQISEDDSDCQCPTIAYPNGGEKITSRNLDIRWDRPKYPHATNLAVAYELFYTDDYRPRGESNWFQIATVPSTAESFLWKIPLTVKSQNCRVAIRCRDYRGFAGDFSYSAKNFSVLAGGIKAPSISSPVPGSSYRVFVPIVFDNTGLRLTQSQRSFYDIYYSSSSNDIDWTPVTSKLAVTSEPFLWDVRELPPGDDYALRVALSDSNDNSSLTVFVRDFSVSPSPINYFYLDTSPPTGSVYIDGNTGFASSNDLSIRLEAFDEITEVAFVQLRETSVDEYGALTVSKSGPVETMSNVKSWILSDGDGEKRIEAVFSDSAGNTISSGSTEAFFRRYVSDDNDEISAITDEGSGSSYILWTAFYDGLSSRLFRNRSLAAPLDTKVTAMKVFGGKLYISFRDDDGLGILSVYDGASVSTVHSFSANDSSISDMEIYGSTLYLAQDNGSLWAFDGTSVVEVSQFDNRINKLFSDGVSLFVFVDHEDVVRIYDGSTFIISEVIDARQQI